MIKIFIDDIEYLVPQNYTILQANEFIGNFIPHFCYHEQLLISGNCRMCLVEVLKISKPVASCALQVTENMHIYTKTPFVQKIRENVLEFLLINHPLDCPICDQGGECDLQNYSLLFGNDRSRFYENKRIVSDKIFNFLIKSIMTRCIHCTRCIRFLNEISTTYTLGTIGRGKTTEISLYEITTVLKTELSGNIIDLCPVGALTSKMYAFKARSWELRVINSVDIYNISLDPIQLFFKNSEILRVFPLKNFEFNNIWISDRIRFSYDIFNLHRLENPLFKKGNQFIKTDWKNSFLLIKRNIKIGKVLGIFGEHLDLSSLYAFKKFINYLGSSNIISYKFYNNTEFNYDLSCYNILSKNFKKINFLDFILFVGIDPRFQFSDLNLYLKNIFIQKSSYSSCFIIGKSLNISIAANQLGWNLNILFLILEGKHKISKILYSSRNPLIILDSNLINLLNFNIFLQKYSNLNISFCFLNENISNTNSFVLGLENYILNKISLIKRSSTIFFLESDIFKLKNINITKQFVIFLGSIGITNLQFANIILPTLSFFEKTNFYLNIYGFLLKNSNLCYFMKNIRNDIKIFKALSLFFNYNITQFKFNILKNNSINFIFGNIKNIDILNIYNNKFNFNINLIENSVKNFYLNSYFLEISSIMQKCSKTILIHKNSYKKLFYNN